MSLCCFYRRQTQTMFEGARARYFVTWVSGATPPTIHNKEVHLRFLQFKGWSLPVTIGMSCQTMQYCLSNLLLILPDTNFCSCGTDPFDARFMWDAKNPNPVRAPFSWRTDGDCMTAALR